MLRSKPQGDNRDTPGFSAIENPAGTVRPVAKKKGIKG